MNCSFFSSKFSCTNNACTHFLIIYVVYTGITSHNYTYAHILSAIMAEIIVQIVVNSPSRYAGKHRGIFNWPVRRSYGHSTTPNKLAKWTNICRYSLKFPNNWHYTDCTVTWQTDRQQQTHVDTPVQVDMDGWLGFDGILSTQVAAISCLKKFKVC